MNDKIREALAKALEDFKSDPAWDRVKHEPLLFISCSDLATDLAPYLAKHLNGGKVQTA